MWKVNQCTHQNVYVVLGVFQLWYLRALKQRFVSSFLPDLVQIFLMLFLFVITIIITVIIIIST